MAGDATTKPASILEARCEAKRASGEAVPLSPSDGERVGVRGAPIPSKEHIERVRRLRKKSTWAERALWRMLRSGRFAGYKFRRQHPYGEYILDFYGAEARLVLETDGGGHGHPTKQLRDANRDAFLQSHGILVKRIWNSQLKREPQVVRDSLWSLLQQRAPHPGNAKPAKRVTSRVLVPDLPDPLRPAGRLDAGVRTLRGAGGSGSREPARA